MNPAAMLCTSSHSVCDLWTKSSYQRGIKSICRKILSSIQCAALRTYQYGNLRCNILLKIMAMFLKDGN